MQTIEQLRKSNYKVRVIHYRTIQHRSKFVAQREIASYEQIMPKGGKTRIELRSPDGIETFGEAICSNEDTFNRKLGNKIALGRAMDALKTVDNKTFPLTFAGINLIDCNTNPVMER